MMKNLRLVVLAVMFGSGASFATAQEYPKPGPEHEKLKAMVGEWDAEVKASFDPTKPPEKSKGEYSLKLEVGGYFLIGNFKGTMLGMPFTGHAVTGYDPNKKKYVGTWVDSMSPSIFHTEGNFDKDGKVYTEVMEGPDPTGKPMKMRMVTTIKDKDHLHMVMYGMGMNGKEEVAMEINYTRKK